MTAVVMVDSRETNDLEVTVDYSVSTDDPDTSGDPEHGKLW